MGVHVPQVEGVDFEVVCPHWPNGFNVIYLFIMQITCHFKRVTWKVIQTVKTNLPERHTNTTADTEHEHVDCTSSVSSVYYDKICLKFASYRFLLYAVCICRKSLNFTHAFKCYQQNCSWLHFSWTTLYITFCINLHYHVGDWTVNYIVFGKTVPL